jgi:hypothetical protein
MQHTVREEHEMSAPAYTLDNVMPDGSGLTFCAKCALPPTALAVLMATGEMPTSMDEAIAMIMLTQITTGKDIDGPVAFNGSGRCDNCNQDFAPFPVRGGDAA